MQIFLKQSVLLLCRYFSKVLLSLKVCLYESAIIKRNSETPKCMCLSKLIKVDFVKVKSVLIPKTSWCELNQEEVGFNSGC